MSIFGLGLGGSLLGGLLGGIGNAQAANAQNRAGQQALQQYTQQTDLGRLLPALLAGGPEAMSLLRATLPADRLNAIFGMGEQQRGALQSELASIEQQIASAGRAGNSRGAERGGGILGRASGGGYGSNVNTAALQQRAQQIRQQLQQGAGQIDPAAFQAAAGSASLNPTRQLEDLASRGDELGRVESQRFDTETQNMRDLLRGYGDAERTRINRTFDEQARDLGRTTRQNAAQAGMAGSSLLPQLNALNSRIVSEGRNDALGQLGDRITSQRLGVESSRGSQGTALRLGVQDRSLSAAAQPINTRLSALTGAAQNPFLGQSTSQYYPGVSGGASALQTFGNSISGFGGLAMGAGALGQQQGGSGSSVWGGGAALAGPPSPHAVGGPWWNPYAR